MELPYCSIGISCIGIPKGSVDVFDHGSITPTEQHTNDQPGRVLWQQFHLQVVGLGAIQPSLDPVGIPMPRAGTQHRPEAQATSEGWAKSSFDLRQLGHGRLCVTQSSWRRGHHMFHGTSAKLPVLFGEQGLLNDENCGRWTQDPADFNTLSNWVSIDWFVEIWQQK